MTINQDVYSFELLKNGAAVSEVTRNSSRSYLQTLLVNNFITIEEGKVFLTERGEVAKKIGIEKYLLLERYEEKVKSWNNEKRGRDIRFLKLASFLVIILTGLLIYINTLLT